MIQKGVFNTGTRSSAYWLAYYTQALMIARNEQKDRNAALDRTAPVLPETAYAGPVELLFVPS